MCACMWLVSLADWRAGVGRRNVDVDVPPKVPRYLRTASVRLLLIIRHRKI